MSVFIARMSRNKQKTVWALLSERTASPVRAGLGGLTESPRRWVGSRSCCPQVAFQAPGRCLPEVPARLGRLQSAQVLGVPGWGGGPGPPGSQMPPHTVSPLLCPPCPRVPCVPLPVSCVSCVPCPVSPSPCVPCPPPCVPCPRVPCVLHSPCQWTVRPSLWTTALRRRPSPLADPPPPCCPPPDAVTGLRVSPPSTRVGQVRWQQPLGLWAQPNPGSSCSSRNHACWALSPLLAGRHLTGGRGVSLEAMQPAGASGAQVHPPTYCVDAGPRPGCGHVRPSVRKVPLLGVCHCFLSSRLRLHAMPGVVRRAGRCARTPRLPHTAWKCPRRG